jgi:hypothetical protein
VLFATAGCAAQPCLLWLPQGMTVPDTGTASSGTDSAALVRCSHGVLSTIGSSGAWTGYPVGTVCEFAARHTPAQGCSTREENLQC